MIFGVPDVLREGWIFLVASFTWTFEDKSFISGKCYKKDSWSFVRGSYSQKREKKSFRGEKLSLRGIYGL